MTDSRYKLVVFDMDDTLYPERKFVRSGYNAVSRVLQNRLCRTENFGEWMWERFVSGKTTGAFNAANEHFNLGLEQTDIIALVEIYRNHDPQISPFDDIPGLLEKISNCATLGVITDGPPEMQHNKFNKLGLADFFQAVVFTGELPDGSAKPSIAPFVKIATDLDIDDHSACVYIGDNPSKDFLGPNLLGWSSIQYHRPGQVHFHKPAPPEGAPQVYVTSPQELLAALEIN
jgi:putative hydrolase of the HAD superfamily